MRRALLLAASLASFVAGCATEGGLRARAAETLGCPESSLKVVSNEGGHAVVAGCGMHGSYAANASIRGSEGSPHGWKLVGWSLDRYETHP